MASPPAGAGSSRWLQNFYLGTLCDYLSRHSFGY
uniref:Uncharacterized protein n=1 Tax=Arundo donax TaxID=35708 RepID=A0A0A9ACX7_ARUDO